MDSLLQETLLFRICVPLAGIGVVTGVARARGLGFGEFLGLTWPKRRGWAAWIAGWIGWVFASDWLDDKLGVVTHSDWSNRSAGLLALVGLGMVLLAPAVEELVFRGALFHVFSRRFGAPAAIVGTALLFAALHLQYGPGGMAMIAADGILLALARNFTGSLYVPFLMHAIGNLFAFIERLPS